MSSGETQAPHVFWRRVRIAAVPGPSTPLLDEVLAGVASALRSCGHEWTSAPDHETDSFVTTARLHEPIAWRDSPLFTGRKRFGLSGKPSTYAFVQVTPAELARLRQRLEAALERDPPDPADFAFPGLAPKAWQMLREQGSRGGAMMCVGRLLQAQAKSLRVVMVLGEKAPSAAYLFDLAGAYPRLTAPTPELLYRDIALRMVTHLSTREVTNHRVVDAPIERSQWRRSRVPAAMLRASRELGARRFFTTMVRIADLVEVPAITGVVAQQYSEGCFGTWDPLLRAQVVTVTGSRHPVVKASLQEDDLAVITGLVDGGCGAETRAVEGLRNDPPSSEAVEFELIDRRLPRRRPHESFAVADDAPVVRSKLHGHRGVASYDPGSVEYVAMDAPYFDFLVSCATEAQARGVADAFARSRALRDVDDPRSVVFTVLPGHGVLMVEKWVPGTRPFDVLLAAMDSGRLEISREVPQGRVGYEPADARMVVAPATREVVWSPAVVGRDVELGAG